MKIDVFHEMRILEECERDALGSGIGAKQRFLELLKIVDQIPKPSAILDVGGTLSTARWLSKKFPDSAVTILNRESNEIGKYERFIVSDAEAFETDMKYDMIFAGEILEHTYNPDGLIASCLLSLKSQGTLIITTPDLACLYNRLFLLFGWTPGNYSASLFTLTGNPILSNNYSEFGFIADHKSVFTRKALVQLLKLYGFEIVFNLGYSYGLEQPLRTIGTRFINPKASGLRLFIDKFLPSFLKEGQLLVCRAPLNVDRQRLGRSILSKSIWHMEDKN